MDFEFSPEENAFREEVAEFIREEGAKPGVLNPDVFFSRPVDTPARREFIKALGRKGYLGVSWPAEYGGGGRSGVYDYLLAEELAYQRLSGTGKGIGIIGRTFMLRGTEEQKARFLPLIRNEEIEWAIGYSEPDAGSDLASLRLRATKDGDGWRLNGQKRFTTSAHFADWFFLAARTNFDVPKHKGVSLFVLEMSSPGITISPMMCMDGKRTNEVFLDNVWVPGDQIIGDPGQGFAYISQALDFERSTLFPFGTPQLATEWFLEWVRSGTRNGKPAREDREVIRAVGRLSIMLENVRLFNLRVLATQTAAEATVYSAMYKIVHSEYHHELADVALDLMGPGSWLAHHDKDAPADGVFDMIRRTAVLMTVGAGSSEIQRNIIARRGLGLPNPI
jgi:3-oxocholest-4-en-26-oyl-CoA dehydrogenase alpha subunit